MARTQFDAAGRGRDIAGIEPMIVVTNLREAGDALLQFTLDGIGVGF